MSARGGGPPTPALGELPQGMGDDPGRRPARHRGRHRRHRERRLRELLEIGLELAAAGPEARLAVLREAAGGDAELAAEALALLEREAGLGAFLDRPAAEALATTVAETEAGERKVPGPRRLHPLELRAPEGADARGEGGTARQPPTAQAAATRGAAATRAAAPRGPEATAGAEAAGSGDGVAAGTGNDMPPFAIPGLLVENLLGEGGMGRVYRARQGGPDGRTVAVKVIRSHLAGPQAARRFAAEQRALARLNHPAIAQLYDAGTDRAGRPYVVLEHVDGAPLTVWCDRRRLTLEARLRLFVEVCRGVEHAHRRQLLHRDLKPSNVLVAEEDGRPVPKIIDFGIARALDAPEGDDTLTGLRVAGTPQYMSPEALAPTGGSRDLDTRTDVYSLGVLLHELLTGLRPFAGGTGDASGQRRRLADGEALRPSARFAAAGAEEQASLAAARSLEPATLVRRLAGDLDWIVLRALARDREERYGSAAALADDLERSLRYEPVTARPPSRLDRAAKAVRRHRVAAVLIAVALAAILAATVLSVLATVRATRAERQAREEAAATREVVGFLVELFDAARPGERRGRDLSAGELVARGAESIEERDLPPRQRALLLHTLADVQMRLGDYASGRHLAGEALAIRERQLDERHPDLLASLDLLANLERRAGRLEEAEEHLERLRRLVGNEGEAGHDPALLADTLNSLANLRWRQDRLEEAEELHRRTLTLRRALAAAAAEEATDAEPEAAAASQEAQRDVAASLNNLGVLLWSQSRYAEAEAPLREAAALAERLFGPRHPLVADALGNLGIVLQHLGRESENEALQRRVVAIREEVQGPEHPDLAAPLHNLALQVGRNGRLEESEGLYRRALELRRAGLGPEHPETLRTASNLALLLQRRGRTEEAEAALREILAVRRRSQGPAHGDVARTLYLLAGLHRSPDGTWEEPAEAEKLMLRALAIQEDLSPPRPLQLASTLHALGEVAEQRNDPVEAARRFRRALELRLAIVPPSEELVEASRQALARVEGSTVLDTALVPRAGAPE